MNIKPIVDETREKMQKGVEFLEQNLKGLRTGRPTPALVDGIKVEAYGNPMPLNQVATISVPDSNQIVVKPFDPSTCTAIEKAILKSDLGITPETDGKVVRLNVPMMSQEQRDKLASKVKEMSEEARITVRNIRRDQNKIVEAAKKDGELSEDLEHDAKEEIQKLTKDMETAIDELAADRVKQIQEG